MKKTNVLEFASRDTISDALTDLLRPGAQQLITQAVEAELAALLSQHSERRTKDGNAVVVCNGHLPARQLQTGLGPVTVKVPKVCSKTGEPVTFRSALVPPYVRKTKSLEAALPWLYLKGISSGEMGEALKVLIGLDAKGLSASTVSRLKQIWVQEYRSWRDEPLDKDRWVYVWADGVYSGLRGEQMKLCALVVIGVNERGEKHFLTLEDGMRESTQSWREVLLKLKSRCMNGPQLAIGDGAMEFWAAQHWLSIRTSNPIESSFGTIRHRTRRSKGCLSRDGMLHMMFKLGQCAETKWRRLRGFDYLTNVITGVKFKDGVEVTQPNLLAA
jgi:putative transposase